MTRYVLIHQRDGIFMGAALGLAFFSLLDTVGQTVVATFASVEEGEKFIPDLYDLNPADLSFKPVECAADHATIDELKAAGLGHLIGDMEQNRLYFPTVGNA